MPTNMAVLAFAIGAIAAFMLARRKARKLEQAGIRLPSRPHYYGFFTILYGVLPPAIVYFITILVNTPQPGTQSWGTFAMAAFVAYVGVRLCLRRVDPAFKARHKVEKALEWLMCGCAALSVFITLAIVMSVLSESIRFFEQVPMLDFLTGLHWSPQSAGHAGEDANADAFGAVPLFAGTMLVMLIAMAVAVPVGLFAAIYTAEYASRRARAIIKPVLEMLAGIPTVVYGFFAILSVAPLIKMAGAALGLSVAAESALAAGLVMGIMIIPFVSSLADDVMKAVPDKLREASLGLGATRSETIRRVILPAALPGIMGGVLLAISRAIGETMIVVMAAGLAANLTINPLEAVTTVTVQIVTLLVGDQEFDSAKTLAAFALGLSLFVFTLVLNIIALQVVKRYREQYE